MNKNSIKILGKSDNLILLLVSVFSVLLTIVIIYFTPIRYGIFSPPAIKDIDAMVFYEQYKSNPDLYEFIDVRMPETYGRQHAIGSRNVPLHTLYFEKDTLPKNTEKTIVLICSLGVASGVGYSYLQHYGFRNILRIDGGIESWVSKGLPTEGSAVFIKYQSLNNELGCDKM